MNEEGLIACDVIFTSDSGGLCYLSDPVFRHAHPHVWECFERGHRLSRWDNLRDSTVRFQHGDNPEHSLMLGDMARWRSCLGFEVDAWVAAIHERVGASPVEEGAEVGDEV